MDISHLSLLLELVKSMTVAFVKTRFNYIIDTIEGLVRGLERWF